MLRFASTRDPAREPVDFDTALLNGLAPDGGLYLPTVTPRLPAGWDDADSLADLAARVLPAWLQPEDADETELADVLREALSFPVPLVQISPQRFVLEVFHGPTLSFKDVGARTMARLVARALDRRGDRLTILVATSGDTGSAVADGFAGQSAIDVVLLYPDGMVSEVQERQLTVARPGVRTFAVRGDFDDCQRLVKQAFVDPELAEVGLSSANSINIGRLLPQSLYYLWASLQLAALGVDPASAAYCVPSGNLGNLTAGVMAKRAGMPGGRFVAAHNRNDFFPGFLTGEREAFAFKRTLQTPSNAMDVGAPSNFERLHAMLGDEISDWVWGVAVGDDATLARIRAEAQAGYLACPHTAVGLEGADAYRSASGHDGPVVTLATAHPAKFPGVLERALGRPGPRSPRLEALAGAETAVSPLEPTLDALRQALT